MSTKPKKPNLILDKIRADMKKKSDQEKSGQTHARARIDDPGETLEVEKPSPVLKSLSDAVTADDMAEVLECWRRGMRATRKFYDPVLKERVEEPDTKLQMEAGKLLAAYKEGLPVARQVVLNTSFEDLHAMQAKLADSPEAMRLLQAMGNSLPSTAQINERYREGDEPTEGSQK